MTFIKNNKLLFLVSVVILFIAGFLSGQDSRDPDNLILGPSAGDSGQIKVVPMQVGPNNYGVAMVDIFNKTLWVYEVNRDGGHNKIRLIAARNWQYDRLLTEYNSAEPKPEQVKEILDRFAETRRKRQLEEKRKVRDELIEQTGP
jgi:hypothetical protein